jgi:hypothetical protein
MIVQGPIPIALGVSTILMTQFFPVQSILVREIQSYFNCSPKLSQLISFFVFCGVCEVVCPLLFGLRIFFNRLIIFSNKE